MAVGIDGHFERLAAGPLCLAQRGTGRGGGPVVLLPDVDARRHCRLPALACRLERAAPGIEGDCGAKEPRRVRHVAECDHGAIARVDRGERRAPAVREAEQRNPIAVDTALRCKPGQRAERVEPAPAGIDGARLGRDGADLALPARIEAVGKENRVALGEQIAGPGRVVPREFVGVPSQCAVHAAAAVQHDHRRESPARRRSRRAVQERSDVHPFAGPIAVEGSEGRAFRERQRRCRRTRRHHGGRLHRRHHRHHRGGALHPRRLHGCQPARSPTARHAKIFSASGRVYAGDDDGSTSVA